MANRRISNGLSRLLGGLLGLAIICTLAVSVQADSLEQQTKRASAKHFHPERGEVSLNELKEHHKHPPLPPKKHLPLDPHLSIFVTDVDTVNQMKLSDVLGQLVKQGPDRTLTALGLFRQWWESAGQGTGSGLGPHCDDQSPPLPPGGIATNNALSTLNGFPYRCPRREVAESSSDPFSNETDSNPNAYSAIAYSNRFDLISASTTITDPITGAPYTAWPDCGEYRIVFARNSGKTDALNRNLIIFEARVPNPDPTARDPQDADAGPIGCNRILNFWHSLSDRSMSAVKRGQLLKKFYLEGLPAAKPWHAVGPVVSIGNYTFGSGQIRANQFMLNSAPGVPNKPAPGAPLDWGLREFKTDVVNSTLVIVPDSVKTNPGNSLFAAAGASDPKTSSLDQSIRGQMQNLLGGGGAGAGLADVNSIGFATGGEGVNAFESDERDATLGDVSAAFTGSTGPNPLVKKTIDDSLTAHGSPIASINAVARIKTQTCAGCHHFSDPGLATNVNTDLGGGAIWPAKAKGDAAGTTTHGIFHPAMDFTQESEKDGDLQPAIVGPNKRYATSLTVEKFLEFREKFMKQQLDLP
jgi:hypothetical protein